MKIEGGQFGYRQVNLMQSITLSVLSSRVLRGEVSYMKCSETPLRNASMDVGEKAGVV
jgi:hypothetical protein